MATAPDFKQAQKNRIGIDEVLAGVRMVESGSYRGNYTLRGPRFGGRSYYGAYQIPTEHWKEWAEAAGIAGAQVWSQQAQDIVAGYIITQYYNRFGNWDLAAMAWFAGPDQAAKVIRRGYADLDSIQNPKIREYVSAVRDAAVTAAKNPETSYLSRTSRLRFAEATPGSGWINPVAGSAEYSNSFRVPRHNKSGIHGAIDVYAAKGTPIVAPVAGKVLSVKHSKLGGYTARIKGTDGVTYYFAHMDSQAVVKQGQQIQAGHHIGYVGDSGNARGTSPHLHLKMTKGSSLVNPYSYLQQSTRYGQVDSNTDDAIVALEMPGMAGTMTNWLQNMSNQVRASATQTAPADEGELADKRQQQGGDNTKMEMV